MITVNIFLRSQRHEWFVKGDLGKHSDLRKFALRGLKRLEEIKPDQKVVSRYVLDRGDRL